MTFSFKRFAHFAITVAFSISAASQYVAATPGDLDTTFGTLGQLYDSTLTHIRGTAIQLDGKIIVVGQKNSQAAIVRYNSDGSVDSSFGTQGSAVLGTPAYTVFYSVVLQQDGKIVAAGRSDHQAFLVRLNANGTLDTTFSSDGKMTMVFVQDFYSSELTDVAIVPNSNQIVVAGTIFYDNVDYPCVEGTDIIFARVNSNGTYDNTFDGNGRKMLDLRCRDILTSMAVHPTNEKIAFTTEGVGDFEVGMLNMDSSFDTSFGGDGMVQTDFNGSSYQDDGAESIAFQRWLVTGGGGFQVWTTRLVVGGTAYGSSATVYDTALARYKLDGSLDTAFDGDGKVRKSISYQYERVDSIAIDSQQRIVTTGPHAWNDKYDFPVVRFTRDGSYDTSFGYMGRVHTPFYFNGIRTNARAYAVAIDPDGKILIGGSSSDGDALMARYEP
jgi:uncharacterized delta-60 repeat protein